MRIPHKTLVRASMYEIWEGKNSKLARRIEVLEKRVENLKVELKLERMARREAQLLAGKATRLAERVAKERK